MATETSYTELQDFLRSLIGWLEHAAQNGSDDEREAARRLRHECAAELQRLHTYDNEQLAAAAARCRALADQLST